MKIRIPQATRIGYLEVPVGGVFDLNYPTSKHRRGRVQGGGTICPTITAGETLILYYEAIYDITMQEPHDDAPEPHHPH